MAAREHLAFNWSEQTLRHWLSPSRHTDEFADAVRTRNRLAARRWLDEPANRDRNRGVKAEWIKFRPWYQADCVRNRWKGDPAYRLAPRMRSRVCNAIRSRGKSDGTMQLFRCTLEELTAHLEGLLAEGMSWDNYGRWHVEHVRPLASFDLADPDQQRQAFHFSNTRPLWAEDNRRKGSLWQGERHQHDG